MLLISINISPQCFISYSLDFLKFFRFKIKIIIFINNKVIEHPIEIRLLLALFWLFISIQILVIFLNNFIHIKAIKTRNWRIYFLLLIHRLSFLLNRMRLHTRNNTTTTNTLDGLILIFNKTIA